MMNSRYYIVFLFLIASFLSCKDKAQQDETTEIIETVSSNLQVDHLNIWVKNPKKAKDKLNGIGFTSVPDSLSQIHVGQGTTGRYFHFLNGYLELIFVYDQNQLEVNNAKHKDLDFTVRANFEENDASPFSVAFKLKDYNIEKIPFEKISYHQDWMDEKQNIYAAKNSKINPKEPSVFVVYPELESERFETLDDLKNIPENYAYARAFYKHPNRAKKITNIIITSTSLNKETETIKALNGIQNVTVKNGREHLMELYFDNNIQRKTFDLRPELPLIVYL